MEVGVSGNSAKTVKCRGIIDTGASITMMAPSIIDALDLRIEGEIPLGGITGARVFSTYAINVIMGGTALGGIRAAGFGEAKTLTGRNAVGLRGLHLDARARLRRRGRRKARTHGGRPAPVRKNSA